MTNNLTKKLLRYCTLIISTIEINALFFLSPNAKFDNEPYFVVSIVHWAETIMHCLRWLGWTRKKFAAVSMKRRKH